MGHTMKPSIVRLVSVIFLFLHVGQSFVPVDSSRLTSPFRREKPPITHQDTITSRFERLPKSKQHTILAMSGDSNEKETSPDAIWLLTLCLPLWLVYVSNQWSRASIYYLVDFSGNADAYNAMNVDIGFSETQYGLLASVAFTALFAIASLGAGVAADRSNRKLLTVVSALGWATATLGTALADSYTQVVLCRVAMGLACAFSTPTAYTLIRDRAPRDRTALATSLYGTGVAVASALSSLSILLDTEFGWRNALNIVAAFGFVSAAVSLLVLEDDPIQEISKSDDADAAAPVESALSFVDDLQEVIVTKRVQWIFLASFLRFCSGLCIGVSACRLPNTNCVDLYNQTILLTFYSFTGLGCTLFSNGLSVAAIGIRRRAGCH